MLECPRCYCELDIFDEYDCTFCSVCDREYHPDDFDQSYLQTVYNSLKEHNEDLRCDND